ncbi:MAG: hypothetical protein AB7S92_18075 [Parvibaculaceae bacterium]
MCDYSLHHVASRPAKVGDKLVTSAFDSSTTHGFCAVGEPNVAVCLRPGTELAFENDVESSHATLGGLGMEIGELGGKVARFTQIDMDRPAAYHDALEFPNGKIVLVTQLRRGQTATVLQLPPSAEAADRKEAAPVREFIG